MPYRIGLVVPSSNTTMETEIPELLRRRAEIEPESFTFHSSRVRLQQVTKEELTEMVRGSDRCALELSDAGVDAIAYACLVAIMSQGPGFHVESERRLAEVAAENGSPTPIVSSAGALVRSIHALGFERRDDDVAAVDDDLAVDAVIRTAREQEAGGPVIPAARDVGVAVLRHHRVGAELVGHVGAGGVREAERLGVTEQLLAGLDAAALVERREQPLEVVDRLDAQEHARAGLLDLDLLAGEQQEHEVDHEVGLLERVDRGPVARERRDADHPRAGVAEQRRRSLGQADVEGRGAEAQRGRHERIGVVLALVHLRQDGDRLSLAQPAELELRGAQIDERERHGHWMFLPRDECAGRLDR